MKQIIFAFTIGVFLLGKLYSQASSSEWELAKDQAGIQVYTRELADSPYKAFKGIVEISCSLDALVEELKDFPSFSQWYYQLKEGKILERQDADRGFCYVILDLPWPVTDRDNIFSYKWERPTADQALLISTSAPAYLPIVEGYVRIGKSTSTWHIERLGPQRVRLTHEAHADPGGKIPAWLANSFVTEAPFSSLKNLRERMERE